MSNDDLLPLNATKAEKDISASVARISSIPVPVRDMWNPATCPANLLPWLAWALSVDNWDASWSDATKRSVIAASISVHYKKGTVGAVKDAIEAAGYQNVAIDESVGTWAEFSISPEVSEEFSKIGLLVRMINSNKPARSQLQTINIVNKPVISLFAPIILVTQSDVPAIDTVSYNNSILFDNLSPVLAVAVFSEVQ